MIDRDGYRVRVIDVLRELYPGRWRYEPIEHPLYPWRHEWGIGVGRFAKFSPRYDGDDDGFFTVFEVEGGSPRELDDPWWELHWRCGGTPC